MNAYREAADQLVRESGCTVRKYRSGNSGVAFCKSADWGIEAPVPRGPISFAVFAHEVGHQLKHRTGSKPRWLEEIEAWEYALAQFKRFALDGYAKAEARAGRSLRWRAWKVLTHHRTTDATQTALIERYHWVDLEGIL